MQHKSRQWTAKKQNQANGKRGILFERKKKEKYLIYRYYLGVCMCGTYHFIFMKGVKGE